MLKTILRSTINGLVGLQSPETIWRQYKTTKSSFMRARLWYWLTLNESHLPEAVRAEFAREKWESDWFFDAWFSKPHHVDHMEARHRVLRHVRALCVSHPEFRTMDDYGCASGTFLRDATVSAPGIEKFRGWEFSAKGVGALKARYPDDERMEFHKTDVDALASAPGPSIIVTVGTLQYMPEEELSAFFRKMRKAGGRAIALSEISQYGLDVKKPSTFRAYETYNYDYRTLLENEGFTVVNAETFQWKAPIRWVVMSAV